MKLSIRLNKGVFDSFPSNKAMFSVKLLASFGTFSITTFIERSTVTATTQPVLDFVCVVHEEYEEAEQTQSNE